MQESEDEEREGIVEQLPHHVRSNLTLERERVFSRREEPV